jgi:hypothetical protein
MTEVCNCWTDDIWKYIHTIARVSSIQSIQEKGAFLCLIISINHLISCPYVSTIINDFIQADHEKIDSSIPRFSEYSSSNERLFKWTYYLHQAVDKALGIKTDSFETFNSYYEPSSINKTVWGPLGWRMLHIIPLRTKMTNGKLALTDQKTIKAFFTCVALLLPCVACKKHCWQYLSTHSIDEYLNSNFHVFQWTVDFHNTVNRRLNQENGTAKQDYSYEDALKLYIHVDAGFNLSNRFKQTN